MKLPRSFSDWERIIQHRKDAPTLRDAYLAGIDAARDATLVDGNYYDPCCGLARQILHNCVCRTVWACPLHGEHHIGSHD